MRPPLQRFGLGSPAALLGRLSRHLGAAPPLKEQRAIVAHIAAETAKLDALRASAERTIALLKERRSALISAAVTGRIAISQTKA
ncbi:MAG: hypothetical protein WC076_01440 [Terrimicrobiaceae bacterium]|nr:hypothetical protein [Terrimicrobiaceae bacterium]